MSAIVLSKAKGTSLPTTDAACSSRFSWGSKRSRRAARIACTVAGPWTAGGANGGFEERLGFAVDPVQVLDDDDDRLHPALAHQEPPGAFDDALPALGRLQPLPLRIVERDAEHREERGQLALERAVQRQEL